MAQVTLQKYTENMHAFIDTILACKSMKTTKVLLIPPPPINVPEPRLPSHLDGDEDDDAEVAKFEDECKESWGFKAWLAKKEYADRVIEIAGTYQEDRVAAVDFWRALTDYELVKEGRDELPPGPVDVSVNGKWPGSGLPGAEEFGRDVFLPDRLHLGEFVSLLLCCEM
jgi:hypothetical protein